MAELKLYDVDQAAGLLNVSPHTLRKWARDLKGDGRDAYVYFNNDTHGHAVQDALDLSELLDQLPASSAHAASRCSQLSSTSSIRLPLT